MRRISFLRGLYFYTLLFQSLEFDIEFNIANTSQYLNTASSNVTFGVPLMFFIFFVFISKI